MEHRGTTRRDFLKLAGAGAAAWTFGRPDFVWATENEPRPNILLVMTDEHNASVLGANGDRFVRTPNMDRLAATGVSFDGCYCNSPLCVPSRESFISGRYISRTGLWSNESELPRADIASVPTLLRQAGYDTYLCGKMHLASNRRYGYEDVGGDFNRFPKNGRCARRRADALPGKGLSPRFEEMHLGTDSSTLAHDRRVTTGALSFLQNRKAGPKPFFLTVGYLAPHFPLVVPEGAWRNYAGKLPMPNVPAGYLDSLLLNYRHLRAGFQVEGVPPDLVSKAREIYYGLTQWVDEQIGRVLESLAKSPFADNTIVIYTADHGENMGEHGLWWKNCVYDTGARVPLIVHWPKRWQTGRRAGACSLVDLSRTIVDMGGGKAPADWDGASMLPWLDHADTPWKDRAVSEYYAHNIASGFVMLRQGGFKYIYHAPAGPAYPSQRELYDLKNDPGELHNLAGDAGRTGLLNDLHAALVKELGESPDDTEKRCRADSAKGYPAGLYPVGRG